MVKIFSQTKDELEKKIKYYIHKDEEIEERYKKALEMWLEWYNENIQNIVLSDLKHCFFYRAYYEEPDIFGIQIWEEKEDVYVWYSNQYVNTCLEENDEKTVILN